MPGFKDKLLSLFRQKAHSDLDQEYAKGSFTDNF